MENVTHHPLIVTMEALAQGTVKPFLIQQIISLN